jgi:hypothetical protein
MKLFALILGYAGGACLGVLVHNNPNPHAIAIAVAAGSLIAAGAALYYREI